MTSSSYFTVAFFVTMRMFCCGNECPKEARLVPADPIVTQYTKLQFECSVPSCLTDLSPDIWFEMKHTWQAVGEQQRFSDNSNGRLTAFFNVDFPSRDAAGLYFCKVSPAGENDIETNVTVSFVKVDKTPAVILVGEETIGTQCLLEPNDQDLVITWDRTSASCDVSENSYDVTFKKLEDVNNEYACYVASKKACTVYGNVNKATEKRAALKHTKDIIAASVTRDAASVDQVKVTVTWMGKDAGKVEVNWLVDGQAVNCTRQSASSSLTVNPSVSLVAVFRLNGFEMKKNISIKINEENSGGHLSGWIIAVITVLVIVAITIAAIVWFMRKKKRGCFKTESNGSKDGVVDGETTQNAEPLLMGETPADEENQVQQLSENDEMNREEGPEQEPLKRTTEEEQATISSNPPNENNGIC